MQEKIENESNKIAGCGWCIYRQARVDLFSVLDRAFEYILQGSFCILPAPIYCFAQFLKFALEREKKTERLFAKSSASSLDLKWLALIRSFREQLQNSNSNATAEFILKFIETL